MRQQHVAHASVKIHARPEQVWNALTDPEMVRQYMEGANVESSWTAGSPITWQGEYRGKSFHDHGKILRAERCRLLEYTHFSPTQGVPDLPENHHTVTIELEDRQNVTHVTLSQDGNTSEEARENSEANWRKMLNGLRQVAEDHAMGDPGSTESRGHADRGARGAADGARDRGQHGDDTWSGPERAHMDEKGQARGQERHRDKEHDRRTGRDLDRDRY